MSSRGLPQGLTFGYDHVETKELIALSDCWTVSGPFQRIYCSDNVSGHLIVDVIGSLILGSAGKFRHSKLGGRGRTPYERCAAEMRKQRAMLVSALCQCVFL